MSARVALLIVFIVIEVLIIDDRMTEGRLLRFVVGEMRDHTELALRQIGRLWRKIVN